MIPAQNVVAWGNVIPWADRRQVEQDLIISRVLVEIFSDELLRDALRFRGGTALNKLHFPYFRCGEMKTKARRTGVVGAALTFHAAHTSRVTG